MFQHKCLAYYRLMRCDRPIGFFLLLWPTLWGLWLAGKGQPALSISIIFIMGVFVMRAAGCIMNDLADRNFDRQVIRTRDRPLANGTVCVVEAVTLGIGLLFIALYLLSFLNQITWLLAIIAVLLVVIYPFAKRWTFFPQCLLGMAWNMGVLMAFTAIQGRIPGYAWLLASSVLVWTIMFDTIYAMADKSDDTAIGLKSTAILFGGYDKVMIGILQFLTLSLWSILAITLNFSGYIVFALMAICACFVYQQWLIRGRDPIRCIQAFSNNHWVGAILFIGILASLTY
jgi:4-hydroxybenzoate polyprenyltransferase